MAITVKIKGKQYRLDVEDDTPLLRRYRQRMRKMPIDIARA